MVSGGENALWLLERNEKKEIDNHSPTVLCFFFLPLFASFLFVCREVTAEDLPKFRYMTMVLKETLRKYPAVVAFSRAVPRDLELGGKRIPEEVRVWGCLLRVFIYAVVM